MEKCLVVPEKGKQFPYDPLIPLLPVNLKGLEVDTQILIIQFSHSVVSDTLWPHGLQHARPHCPSPTPTVYSNSSPLSQWCHPTISSSVVPFFSHLQPFPTSGSFQMHQFFTLGGQSIGVSASKISPSSEHSGLISFRMDWLDFLAVQGTLKSLLQQHSSKASILWRSKNQDTVVLVVKEAQRSTRQNREPKYKSIQGQITDFWGRSKSSSMVEG